MSAQKEIPHTIDNLCKKDKGQVIEMLKQLNELKKRCSNLESAIDEKNHENQRINGRNEVLSQQLESIEAKLFESVELSKDAQSKIEILTTNLQNIESDNNLFKSRIRDSEAEVQNLRKSYHELNLKYDRILVDTSVLCGNTTVEQATSTDDYAIKQRSVEVQVGESAFQNLSNDSSHSEVFTDSLQEPDKDLIDLIKLLNHQQ